jgi:Uma2 family endonuclease
VPEYWIFDIRAKAVDVHTEPVDGRYTSVIRYTTEGVLRPVALPDLTIDVAEIRWD